MAAIKDRHQHWLVLFAVLCAAVSAYYYFRIIQAMFFKESSQLVKADGTTLTEEVIRAPFKILLIITALLIIGLGLFPSILVDWLHY
jgi:NADH-quinone oxidoreductase subunit N